VAPGWNDRLVVAVNSTSAWLYGESRLSVCIGLTIATCGEIDNVSIRNQGVTGCLCATGGSQTHPFAASAAGFGSVSTRDQPENPGASGGAAL